MSPRPKKCTAKCRNRLLYSVNPLTYSAALPGALVPAKFELVRGEIKLTILLLPIYHTMECSFFGPEASLLCNVIPVFVYCRRRRSQQSGKTGLGPTRRTTSVCMFTLTMITLLFPHHRRRRPKNPEEKCSDLFFFFVAPEFWEPNAWKLLSLFPSEREIKGEKSINL